MYVHPLQSNIKKNIINSTEHMHYQRPWLIDDISRNKDKKIGKNMQTKYMYKFTKTFSCSSADIASNCEIRSV